MMDLLQEQFGLNPLNMFGLPSFGFASMMKSYPKHSPSLVSCPKKFTHLRKLFRQSIIWVIVNPISRHVTTNQEEQAAPTAKMNSDGKPYDYIVFWDITALYPAGYKND